MEIIRQSKQMSIPNLLTLVRIGLLPFVITRFYRGDMNGALCIYLISMLTDIADGVIARRFHQETDLGKLLDPLADKLSSIVLLGLFTVYGQMPLWVFILIVLKEVLLIAGSICALHAGIVVYALPVGKLTTFSCVLSILFRFLGLRYAADLLLCVFIILSFVSLLWYYTVVLNRMNHRDTPFFPYRIHP